MSHEEGSIKALRPNEFTRRTHRRAYGEEGQGQILGENLYLKLEKKRKWRRHRDNRENKRGLLSGKTKEVRISQECGMVRSEKRGSTT